MEQVSIRAWERSAPHVSAGRLPTFLQMPLPSSQGPEPELLPPGLRQLVAMRGAGGGGRCVFLTHCREHKDSELSISP